MLANLVVEITTTFRIQIDIQREFNHLHFETKQTHLVVLQ